MSSMEFASIVLYGQEVLEELDRICANCLVWAGSPLRAQRSLRQSSRMGRRSSMSPTDFALINLYGREVLQELDGI